MVIYFVTCPIKHGGSFHSFLYPLVNVYITMERSTMLLMGKLTISMAIFNSYFDITRGYVYQVG